MSNNDKTTPATKSKRLKDFSFIKGTIPTELINKDSLTNSYMFYKGNLNLLRDRANISAIVGARDPLPESQKLTRDLVKYLVTKEQKTIISGFAKGIDSIALETALEFNGNRIGILSISIEEFMKSHKKLVFDDSLLLLSLVNGSIPLSPFEYKTNPLRRNKYIYALSSESFVVECNKINQGGTWAGAKQYLRKIYLNVEKKSNVYIAINENFPAHAKLLKEKGAKPFRLKDGKLKRDCEQQELFI
ncbi:TPA: hypothetical protein GX533_00505 [Candidatus Dojkabacteria bacterium]|jgi:hypothetical protein|uniref:Smf/DprA SLOG domain-containing protein n=1 Tax=Candidatus Dojkabacteria bacterium TaxID=2099670 RepID=A0A832QD29_9BACT|nr:hypothetical protein [Candidatus Dojkabacteria bacterium]